MSSALYRVFLYFCACMAIIPLSLVYAAPQEPPRKCEITRGAWCLVKGTGKIEIALADNEQFHKWRIFDAYWQKEVGLVMEGLGCADTVADTIEVVHVNSNVLLDGQRWREAVVRLRKDNGCSLRLLVPTQDQLFLKKAAVSLSGHVAACMEGRVCTENILAPRLYDSLVTGDMPSPK